MTDRDSTTRTRARAPGEEDYPPSTAVHWRVTDPTLSGIFVDTNAMHEGRKQTNTGPAHAGSRLKLTDALGRRRPKCHPSSRTGENPPYGMIGGIEETSASFEARSAPRSYPTPIQKVIHVATDWQRFISYTSPQPTYIRHGPRHNSLRYITIYLFTQLFYYFKARCIHVKLFVGVEDSIQGRPEGGVQV